MGASPSSYSAALTAACGLVRREPKLAHWLSTGDPQAVPLIARFRSTPGVYGWLKGVAFRRWDDQIEAVIRKADEFVNESGQADLIVTAYASLLDSGRLDGYSTTRLGVVRAVFTLGVLNGAPVLASRRYLQTLLRVQSGIDVSHTAVAKHVSALARDRLLTYDEGRPGIRPESGRIWLDLPSTAPESLDAEALLALTLTHEQILALEDYRRMAQADASRRSDAADRPFVELRASVLRAALEERERLHNQAIYELRDLFDNLHRPGSSGVPKYERKFIHPKHVEHDLSSLKAEVTRRDHMEAAEDLTAFDPFAARGARALLAKLDEQDRLARLADEGERARLRELEDVDVDEMRRVHGEDWRPG